jgi:hypothetical protein
MGYWGITERESDAGLDLLAVIADTQLKPAGYTVFNVEEALELVKAGCLDRIRRDCRGCSAERLLYYINVNFHDYFTNGALLIAECLADYYRTGALAITEYTGGSDSVDYYIKEFVVTQADLKILLEELESVQDPEHEKYQAWMEDSSREKWLAHIRSVCEALEEHKTGTGE